MSPVPHPSALLPLLTNTSLLRNLSLSASRGQRSWRNWSPQRQTTTHRCASPARNSSLPWRRYTACFFQNQNFNVVPAGAISTNVVQMCNCSTFAEKMKWKLISIKNRMLWSLDQVFKLLYPCFSSTGESLQTQRSVLRLWKSNEFHFI